MFRLPFIIFLYYSGTANADLLMPSSVPLIKEETAQCKWMTLYNGQECPVSLIDFYLYTENDLSEIKINPLERNGLQTTDWNPHKHNIIYLHGYGSGHKNMPTVILRNAYLNNGSYNIFVVDWGPYAKMPCYASAVYNINAVAKCTAHLYRSLRSQGIPSHLITCVGHDLGAHTCGLISKYIDFRMNRIIGLDPAGPMIPDSSKLQPGMANHVQVLHTNAGSFGDKSSSGKINFCFNGGKLQPTCQNRTSYLDLCSHLMSVCYMAESIDSTTARIARPCARHCPFGSRKSQGPDRPVFAGQLTPDKASGSYCVHASEPPYCSKSVGSKGHPWCCMEKL